MSALSEGLQYVCERVRDVTGELNELDGWAGDGDLGVTMAAAANAVLVVVADNPNNDSATLLKSCGAAIAREAPSTSGTLLATGLLRAADSTDGGFGDASALARMLSAALSGITERGKAELGGKTMLDALAPAADAANVAANAGQNLREALKAAADAADMGSRSTVNMTPRYGRAGWLPQRSLGHEDGGARAIALILMAAASYCDGKTGVLYE